MRGRSGEIVGAPPAVGGEGWPMGQCRSGVGKDIGLTRRRVTPLDPLMKTSGGRQKAGASMRKNGQLINSIALYIPIRAVFLSSRLCEFTGKYTYETRYIQCRNFTGNNLIPRMINWANLSLYTLRHLCSTNKDLDRSHMAPRFVR